MRVAPALIRAPAGHLIDKPLSAEHSFSGQLEVHRRLRHEEAIAANLSPSAATLAPLVMALSRLAARRDARSLGHE